MTTSGKRSLSIIIPIYNEAASIEELYKKILTVLNTLSLGYEIIFIDDGSTDNSFPLLEKLHNQDKDVKVIQFQRNFGKSAALDAGFQSAQGKIVITMDGDLQDDPGEIPKFIKKIKEGYDLVSGWKYQGKGKFFRAFPSKVFNKVTFLSTGIRLHDFNCPFKAYRNEIVKNIKLYGELHRYIPVLVHMAGYKITEIKVENLPRIYGKSKYGIKRFFRGFFDLLTTLFITRYTTKPLHFFGFIGLILFLLGLGINLLLLIWKYMVGLIIAQGRPFLALLLGIFLTIVGLQFFSIGLIGEMIINVFPKEKNYYSIRKRLG